MDVHDQDKIAASETDGGSDMSSGYASEVEPDPSLMRTGRVDSGSQRSRLADLQTARYRRVAAAGWFIATLLYVVLYLYSRRGWQ